MGSYKISPKVDAAELRAAVLSAALAIAATGDAPTERRLRDRGVRGDSRRIGATVRELIGTGELPATCQRGYRTHGNARTMPGLTPAPLSHHAPEEPPTEPVLKRGTGFETPWDWQGYSAIMGRIYGPGWRRLYRRAMA